MLDFIVPRVLQEYNYDHLWDRLPWALLALGVVLGGILVAYLVKVVVGYFCLPRGYRKRYVLTETRTVDVETGRREQVFRRRPRKPWGSIVHLALETFFFVSVVIVMWIGAHVAGFNFWTSSLVGVGLGLVGTYIFGAGLQHIGAGYFVFLTDKVERGWFIRVAGVEGRIIEIHPLYVVLETREPKHGGALHHQVPMTNILSAIVSHDVYQDEAAVTTIVDGSLYGNGAPPPPQMYMDETPPRLTTLPGGPITHHTPPATTQTTGVSKRVLGAQFNKEK